MKSETEYEIKKRKKDLYMETLNVLEIFGIPVIGSSIVHRI